jgi:SAM-dependent MidA family methyltransferase
MSPSLPPPTTDALAASEQLTSHIINEIVQEGGWISFARFMELALYTPKLGYYTGGAQKLGQDGDFTTAPLISSLYGRTFAHIVAALFSQTQKNIMELGAGTGKLAFDILTELTKQGIVIAQYIIVDLSGELQKRQEETLQAFPQVVWLNHIPPSFSGIIIANEVLDAIPVHLVTKTPSGWQECGVSIKDQQFVFSSKNCDPHLIQAIPEADNLPIGYLTEIHPIAEGLISTLSQSITQGFKDTQQGSVAFLIDYGFPAREFYLDQRHQGTLMCHYRHHVHTDPFYLPGLQDITAHVNFTAMAQRAIDQGLDILGYYTQANFLINGGISNFLSAISPDDAQHYVPLAHGLQKLLSPAEMGELFKVLVIGLHTELPTTFAHQDQSYRL